jgi:N-acetylglucosamine-6-phosphate deacetylase
MRPPVTLGGMGAGAPHTLRVAARRALVGGRLVPAVLEIEDGRIVAIARGADGPADVRLEDGILAPGLVDLQINGAFGVDFGTAEPDAWCAVLGRLPDTGVTTCLPTLISAPLPELVGSLGRAAAVLGAPRPPGARMLGVHLEGPFLAEARRGAHAAAHLCDPTPDRLDALLAAAPPGVLAVVTLAPERAGGLAAIRRLCAAGVRVSIGHSDATGDTVFAAADAGASLVTHLFNAQRGIHQREPGVSGAALVDRRLTCGLILDLRHVAPDVARLAFAAAAPGRIALVTDAVAAAGMPPGGYELGGAAIEVPADGPPTRPDGTLAGSVLRLDQAVANAVGLGLDPVAAIEAASRVPADGLGRPDLGRIAVGARADLVWLDDAYQARATWVDAEPVHGAEALP